MREAITPAGFAYFAMPFSGISSMQPMLFCRNASRRMPRTFARVLLEHFRAQPCDAPDDEQQGADLRRQPEIVEDSRQGPVDVQRDWRRAIAEGRFESAREADAVTGQPAVLSKAEEHRHPWI